MRYRLGAVLLALVLLLATSVFAQTNAGSIQARI
jgi:hypothetical protein